jgi:DnaJ-class molecular chaperone
VSFNFSVNDIMRFAESKSAIDGWQAYRWEQMKGGYLVKGCVPDGVYRSGRRKGRPRFKNPVKGTELSIVVSDADMKTEAEIYEETTGNCWDCKGKGEVFQSWHHIDGTKYKPCQRCNATGACSHQDLQP